MFILYSKKKKTRKNALVRIPILSMIGKLGNFSWQTVRADGETLNSKVSIVSRLLLLFCPSSVPFEVKKENKLAA